MVAVRFQNLELGAKPILLSNGSALSEELGSQVLAPREKVHPAEHIQVCVNHYLFQQSLRRLGWARGKDHPGNGVYLLGTEAESGQHASGNPDVNDLIFRKITLRPTFAEPAINFPVSNQLLRDGLIDANALVTHTFGFENAKEIMGAVIDGSQPIVKAVMLPND